MLIFVLQKCLKGICIYMGAILVLFLITNIILDDVALIIHGQRGEPESLIKLRDEVGHSDPLHIQLIRFFKFAFTFQKKSYLTGEPVYSIIINKVFPTLTLLTVAMVIAVLFGILLGVILASIKYEILNSLLSFFIVFGLSIPTFIISLLCIILFKNVLNWFPDNLIVQNKIIYIYFFPAIALAFRPMLWIIKWFYELLLEVSKENDITFQGNGILEKARFIKKGLADKNILFLSMFALRLSAVFSMIVLVENIFDLHGIGHYCIWAFIIRDFSVFQGIMLSMTLTLITVNVLIDIFYGVKDTKIFYQ